MAGLTHNSCLSAPSSVEIDVDIEHPERNRELNIFHFTGKKESGKLHNGFAIEMEVDPRDVKDGRYAAYLLPNCHQVFLKVPGQTSTYRIDHHLVATIEQANHCSRIQEARDVSRNAIEKDETRMCKHILLKFPSNMELSNAIYSTNPRDSQMKMTIVPYPIKFDFAGGEFQLLKCRVVWKLHLVEEEERIVEEAREKSRTAADELADALKGMTFK